MNIYRCAMEKKKKIKPFLHIKTNVRALQDGCNLINRNATMLLLSCGLLMLGISVLCAFLSVMKIDSVVQVMLGTKSLGDISLGVFALTGAVLLLVLFFEVMVFAIFKKFTEHGFIPQITWKSVWKPALALSRRSLLVLVWGMFEWTLFLAITYYLYTMSVWLLIPMDILGVFLCFWIRNQVIDFSLGTSSLIDSITASLKLTTKGFMSFLGCEVLLLIVMIVLVALCLMPSATCIFIDYKAQLSIMMGDEGDLPGYFTAVYFIASMVTSFLILVILAYYISCTSMLYGAVLSRISRRNDNSNPTDISSVE